VLKNFPKQKRKRASEVGIDAARELAAWQFFMAASICKVKDVDF